MLRWVIIYDTNGRHIAYRWQTWAEKVRPAETGITVKLSQLVTTCLKPRPWRHKWLSDHTMLCTKSRQYQG